MASEGESVICLVGSPAAGKGLKQELRAHISRHKHKGVGVGLDKGMGVGRNPENGVGFETPRPAPGTHLLQRSTTPCLLSFPTWGLSILIREAVEAFLIPTPPRPAHWVLRAQELRLGALFFSRKKLHQCANKSFLLSTCGGNNAKYPFQSCIAR